MSGQSQGTPRLQPHVDAYAAKGYVADSQESSRPMKKDFYTALKLSGATSGLPPLRPTTTSALIAARGAQRPVTAGDSPRVDGEMLDPALTALAFRAGSLQGLPELQVIVRDAVTDTIQSIHPIVVDMVTKLLTKETIRVTKRTALALSQEQLGELQASQEKTSGALEHFQDSCNQQLASVRAEKDDLEETCRQLSEACQSLAGRVQMLEHNLQRVALLETQMSQKESQVEELRGKLESNFSDLKNVQKNATEFEQRCRLLFVTPQKLEKVAQEVTQSAKSRESTLQHTLENALTDYVLATDLAGKLEELEVHIRKVLQQDSGYVEEKWRSVWTVLNDTRSTLFGQFVTKEYLVDEWEDEDKKRIALRAEFAGQISDLQRKDDEQEHLIRDLLDLRAEREQMSETFRQTRSEVNEQSAELTQKFESFTESIRSYSQDFNKITEQLKHQQQFIDQLMNASSKMKEELQNDRMRATATFSQQQHNRKELNYLLHRIDEIDEIRSDMQVQQTGSMENTTDISTLQDQVSQWKDAIAAQHELRKETSNLHGEVEAIRGEIAKLADDQQLAVANLRSVHTAWLTGTVSGMGEM